MLVDVEILSGAIGVNGHAFVWRSCLLIAVSCSGQPGSWGVSESAIF